MATEESPGSSVIDAVIDQAKRKAWEHWHCVSEANRAMEQMQAQRDLADGYREQFEQCKQWLDEHVPDWRDQLSEKDREKLVALEGRQTRRLA